MKGLSTNLYRLEVRLARPVEVRPGLSIDRHRSWLVELQHPDGACGWGEAVHLPGFSPMPAEETEAALLRSVEGFRQTDLPPRDEFACLWHMACRTLAAASAGRPVRRLMAPEAPDVLPLCGLVPGPAAQVAEQFAQQQRRGVSAVKIKLGREAAEREAEAVADVLGPAREQGIRLRLDANRAWSWDELCAFSRRCTRGREAVQWLEEPLKNPSNLWKIPEELGWAVALDESWRETGYERPEWAGAFVWKPSLGAWPRPVLDDVMQGRESRPLVLSAAYESPLGLGQLAEWAAALAPRVAAGLDTMSSLADDLLGEAGCVAGGVLNLDRLPAPGRIFETLQPECISHG